jgi:hypothetical protein
MNLKVTSILTWATGLVLACGATSAAQAQAPAGKAPAPAGKAIIIGHINNPVNDTVAVSIRDNPFDAKAMRELMRRVNLS